AAGRTGWGARARAFGLPGDLPPLDPSARPALADDLGRAIGEADALADRRDAEGERLARHGEIGRRLEQARRSLAALDQGEARLAARARAHEERWRALWSPARAAPPTSAEMTNWLSTVATLIGERDAVSSETTKLDALAKRDAALAPVLAALARELGVPIDALPPALAVRELDMAITALADAWQSRREA